MSQDSGYNQLVSLLLSSRQGSLMYRNFLLQVDWKPNGEPVVGQCHNNLFKNTFPNDLSSSYVSPLKGSTISQQW